MDETRAAELVEFCQRLVRTKSYSGQEQDAAAVLADEMRALGYDDVIVDKYGSVIGTIEGNRPGPTVLFDGHIDTVPAENAEKWAYPPFEARIADGRIYGRGTSDMKGADAAFTKAVAWFAADRNRDFAGRICVAGVVQEECFEGVASRSVSEICKPDYVIIGESSMCNLKVGQRGRAEIKIEARGVPAHSANPEKGVNAVYKMCGVIDAVRRIVPGEHTVLGRGILELLHDTASRAKTPEVGVLVVEDHGAHVGGEVGVARSEQRRHQLRKRVCVLVLQTGACRVCLEPVSQLDAARHRGDHVVFEHAPEDRERKQAKAEPLERRPRVPRGHATPLPRGRRRSRRSPRLRRSA